jgi:hypothetical protein
MKRIPATVALLALAIGAAARAAEFTSNFDQPTDTRTFEITPAAPPYPALKYQFLFDDLQDTRPGNAAILYLDSILFLSPEVLKAADSATEAYTKNDMNTFGTLVDSFASLASGAYTKTGVFEELDLAGRTENCDWQPPLRDRGGDTLLPHLYPIAHGLTRILQLRALRQIDQSDLPTAIKTLRLGYEMANKTGTERTLISGLVAVRVTRAMNNVTIKLMNRPDAPNLYWALAEMPPSKNNLRHSFDGERLGTATATIKLIARVRGGEQLSAAQWHEVFDSIDRTRKAWAASPADQAPVPDPVTDAPADLVKKSQAAYAESYNVPLDQAQILDPAITLGNFYLDQYAAALDDMYKLRGLPYPEFLAKLQEYDRLATKWKREQPTNPFIFALPVIRKGVLNFARADRELAAMTTVEALRSYAAANSGKLPAHLEDVTDTPVPQNPLTGQPFDYQLADNTAILSDPTPDAPLTYTITIRK